MRRKSVWKQRAIAYLAAVSLAVGMIPASLPAADAYAEETDVEETAVLEADVQQADEQELGGGQEVDEQEADVKEAEREADEQEAQPEAEESDDSIIAPEQAVNMTTADWYDYADGGVEKIEPTDMATFGGVTNSKIKMYNNSSYIEGFDSTIYDINDGENPTALVGTFETIKNTNYRFSFDYIQRYGRGNEWNLYELEEKFNTFDVYVYFKEPNRESDKLDDIINSQDCFKVGTFLGQYKDWSRDVFSFKATGDRTTIIFKAKEPNFCAALVTKMELKSAQDYKPSNYDYATDSGNLVKNGICEADEGGWKPNKDDGDVKYEASAGNVASGIELKGDNNGVSQSLTKLLVKGDKIEYAFDITGLPDVNSEYDAVEVYLVCDGTDPKFNEKLTTVEVKDGEWQTVSGFCNIEDETPHTYKIILKAKTNGESGAVIDNVSVMLKSNPTSDERKDALDKLKEEAKDAVDYMKNLEDGDKEKYKQEIDATDNLDDALDKLKEAAKKDLEEKADKAHNEIGTLVGEPLKSECDEEVDAAETKADAKIDDDATDTVDKIKKELLKGKDEIDEAVDKAKDAADVKTSLEQDKDDAKDSIKDMNKLSDTEKNKANEDIDKADNKEEVRNTLKDAAKTEIERTADEAKQETQKLPNLTQPEKNKVKDDIDKAAADAIDKIEKGETIEEITDAKDEGIKKIGDLLEDAKKKDADNGKNKGLDDTKKDGKDKIDDMDNLSDPEKNKYKDEIDKADSDEKINEIIKDAAKKDIDNQAKDAKDKIDKNNVLTDDDKDELKKEVDKAAADAKNNINAAKNPDEIKKAADDGKDKINAIVNQVNKVNSLTDAEKELWKNSQSFESVNQSILTTNTDKGETKGSCFSKLRLKGIGQNKKIKLKWKKQSGADGYIIYGSACGKNIKMKKVKDIPNGKKTTWTQKKLKKGTYYKYKVVAYKTIAGQKRVIAQSISVHATTDGGKKGNPTKAIVKSKKNITLKKGKKTKIKATYGRNKKVAEHIRIVRFESAKPEIATVNKKGQVKAKKPGKCTIFVYTQNGYFTTVKVTVKK